MNNFFLLYFDKTYLVLLSYIIKFFLSLKGVKIGKNFKSEGFPKINSNNNSKIIIGDNFYLCKDVELRVGEGSIIQIENNCKIDRGVRLISCNNSIIKISDGNIIGYYSVINAGDNIIIGRKCLISGFVYLQSSSHGKSAQHFIRDQNHSYGEIIIEDDVWIGAHSVILKGVNLKQGCIIGANSVINFNCDKYTIYAGNPAKKISMRS
jgi:acetyltransferase-like isoleucine patch superfamily enzyme